MKLVYYEVFQRIDEAYYREKQIQGWSRAKKEALIRSDANLLIELSKRKCDQVHREGLREPFDILMVTPQPPGLSGA